ncbi:amidohydrolase [Aestuariicella hydrocarbonica]|uniref:Amidohydrolase n=1 Tax=Pseudomaricurvus hydrocarbonicus TaxID=1470433 RepID=A0A9E5MHT7_9GAMM|nr:amidohydrolase [Aestuariicella hydrocarbonica]NHO66381.1 amidohydrolase [Aestuariicella hydrocarbonica]
MIKTLKYLFATALILVAAAALSLYLLSRPPSPPSSQVFLNGQVLTMNADNTISQAIAVADNKIVAVGSNEDIKAFINKDTLVHDLEGKTLMPGIIDAHGHFPGSGVTVISADLSSPPVGNITTIPELQDRLRQRLARKEAGQWVTGFGYDDTLLAEHRHPTRQELDAVSTEHPIYITHVSGHMGVGNSLALEMSGYNRDTPNPDGGVIVKDDSGELTGLLEETAAQALAFRTLDISAMEFYELLTTAVDDYASKGVTTAQSGGVDGMMLKGIYGASQLGLIPFRLELWPFYDKLGEQILSGELNLDDYNSDRVHARTIKIVDDGSIQGFTGYLSHPYHEPFRGNEEYRGYPNLSREKLTDWVERFHSAGYQLAIHGNGDASIDDIIYAFDQAQKKHPVDDPRMILIHSQMARDDQLDAMKRLGITPSFFSAHTYYWGDRHRDIFMGPERAMRMSPTHSAQQRNLTFSVHLDTPVVPMDPMLMVWATVNRLSSSGQVIGEEQRIDPMSALRAVTIDAAWQIFQEDKVGSLEVGKLADLVVLNRSPLVNPESIKDIEVEQTYVGGVAIFARH